MEEKKINHIAVIMDGNSRWAKSKGLPTKLGHKKGSENLEKICDYCMELDIKHLTLYAFSTENWKRPKEEVDYLMTLLRNYFKNDIKKLHKKGVKVRIIGCSDNVPEDIQKTIKDVEEQTKDNNTLHLNIAFSYGGRREILDATKSIAKKVKEGLISIEDIDDKLFKDNLYNTEMPDPDLVIRTGGSQRISNFLLWQIAYSEMYYVEKFWPAFTKKDLVEAIENFKTRERRYGGRKRKEH